MSRWQPDPTFHPSPRFAMEAPRDERAWVVTLDTDGNDRPDGLAEVDLDPRSADDGTVVERLRMPAGAREPRVPRYLRVTRATWDVDLGSVTGRALIERIEREGASVFRAQPGFVRYRLMRASERETIAVAEWETEERGVHGAAHFRAWLARSGIEAHLNLDTAAGPVLVAVEGVSRSESHPAEPARAR